MLCLETVCPVGFVRFQKQCYKFSDEKKTWSDARSACQSLEGDYDLAMVDTKEINEFVVSQAGSNNYWIGLHDMSHEGKFQWVDDSHFTFGTTFEEYPWGSGEPNNLVRPRIFIIFYYIFLGFISMEVINGNSQGIFFSYRGMKIAFI